MSTAVDIEPTIRRDDTGAGRTVVSPSVNGGDLDGLARSFVAQCNEVTTVAESPDDIESIDVITFDSDELPCRLHDADLWFAERPADLEAAKAHCHECPLRLECLEGALERAEPWGVWGGEIFDHGVVIARKRPRGRPRKNDRNDQDAPVAA